MNELERFIACMEYRPADRRPNHELGAWPQTWQRWRGEAPAGMVDGMTRNWFVAEDALKLDRREYISVDYGFVPPFQREVLEETEDYEIVRDARGIVTRALKAGTVGGVRMSMDQHLRHPVETPDDWQNLKKRLVPALAQRYPKDLDEKVARWRRRDYPLVLGCNCQANGFYWRAREFMGTENLSLAWYDYPEMMHDMMEYFADFIMETSRPVLEKTGVEYFTFNEDMSMKGGPLLGPETFRTFIFPHLRRLVDFFKSHGVRYVAVDTDGDPRPLVPLLMEAGVDILWPLERASDSDPLWYRREYGRDLRLWGGVDKRVLARGPRAIREHLRALVPLVEEGGYIPSVDHTVPPDVSWDNFAAYMEAKWALITGDAKRLED